MFKLFLEVFQASPLSVYGFGQLALRFSTTVGREGEEVEYVVPGLGGIVEQGPFGFSYHLFERLLGVGCSVDKPVEVVEIGLFMLAIVVLDGLLADDRS